MISRTFKFIVGAFLKFVVGAIFRTQTAVPYKGGIFYYAGKPRVTIHGFLGAV